MLGMVRVECSRRSVVTGGGEGVPRLGMGDCAGADTPRHETPHKVIWFQTVSLLILTECLSDGPCSHSSPFHLPNQHPPFFAPFPLLVHNRNPYLNQVCHHSHMSCNFIFYDSSSVRYSTVHQIMKILCKSIKCPAQHHFVPCHIT